MARLQGMNIKSCTSTVLAAIGGLAVLALVLAGCATSRPAKLAGHATDVSTHRPTGTVTRTFSAYDRTGKLTVAVTGSRRGSCWTTSIAAPGHHTFRCISGNQILDPCFARPGTTRGTVACVADPWSKAVALHLTKALPTHTYGGHRVWAFRRADGVGCVAATGTVAQVHGKNLAFTCQDGTSAALFDRHTRTASAAFARPGASTLRHAGVRTIWHV